MKKDSFEDLFKNSFENFESEVNSGVWTKIQNALKATGVGAIIKTLFNKVGSKTVIAVISSVIILITSFFLLNIGEKKTRKESEQKNEAVPPNLTPITVVQNEQQKVVENKVSENNQNKENLIEKNDPLKIVENTKKPVKVEEEGRVSDSLKNEVLDNLASITKFSEFTPNSDGLNDEFVFQSKNINKMSVLIYDKDANIVYNYKGIDGKWDGKNLDGKNANEGYYLYLISAEGVGGKKYEQKGKVKLTR